MEGYSKVACLMSTYPEFAILRSFRGLNMQNLLYLQAEITHLEAELRHQAAEDIASCKRPDQEHDWWSLTQGHEDGDARQWSIVLKIREKLDKYNEALLRQSAILGLDHPTTHNLQTLRSWFERPLMGSFPLYGLDRTSWDKEHEEDLVCLRTQKPPDVLSRIFSHSVIPTVHHLLPAKLKRPVSEHLGTGLYEYNDSTIRSFARVATVVIASVLPLCSVVILYVVRSNGLRLGIIIVLSALFSLALALMTNARNIEIFAATSAYVLYLLDISFLLTCWPCSFAAVNVVYLTNGAPGTLSS
ncbi:hypothetical protein BCR34DRAFT_482138 [Clohesyomyces aquaticus]|uniref:DUF6594 domain-containing protein n=1 Tax=Clohesyomyces aquaticus TaxID=1231657 RepID=A0A1Y1ZQZ2_9PLEO|nr:hypothetical protein BCR34DRAFT_482138 [Clohesyomyces aquaticus]